MISKAFDENWDFRGMSFGNIWTLDNKIDDRWWQFLTGKSIFELSILKQVFNKSWDETKSLIVSMMEKLH